MNIFFLFEKTTKNIKCWKNILAKIIAIKYRLSQKTLYVKDKIALA